MAFVCTFIELLEIINGLEKDKSQWTWFVEIHNGSTKQSNKTTIQTHNKTPTTAVLFQTKATQTTQKNNNTTLTASITSVSRSDLSMRPNCESSGCSTSTRPKRLPKHRNARHVWALRTYILSEKALMRDSSMYDGLPKTSCVRCRHFLLVRWHKKFTFDFEVAPVINQGHKIGQKPILQKKSVNFPCFSK